MTTGDGSVALAHHHHRSFPPHGPPFSRHAHLHSLRASLDGAAGPVQPHPPVLGARHLLGLSRFLCPRPPNHHSSPSQPPLSLGSRTRHRPGECFLDLWAPDPDQGTRPVTVDERHSGSRLVVPWQYR